MNSILILMVLLLVFPIIFKRSENKTDQLLLKRLYVEVSDWKLRKSRKDLNVESGLNDGICVPILFVLLAIAISQNVEGSTFKFVIHLFVALNDLEADTKRQNTIDNLRRDIENVKVKLATTNN